jgi:hypothetical protein
LPRSGSGDLLVDIAGYAITVVALFLLAFVWFLSRRAAERVSSALRRMLSLPPADPCRHAVDVTCPSCHASLSVPWDLLGQKGMCNKCNSKITLPDSSRYAMQRPINPLALIFFLLSIAALITTVYILLRLWQG